MALVKLPQLAASDDEACAIVRKYHPRAGHIEACERGEGWDVFVYATEERFGDEPADSPGVNAQFSYRVEQEVA